MPYQSWITLANSGQANQNTTGAPYASSSSLTQVSPGAALPGQAFTIPAAFLVVGHALRFTAAGIFSTTGTPTLNLGLYYGTGAGVMAATGAITCASGAANNTFVLQATSRVTAVGAGTAGQIVTQGFVVGIGGPATIIALSGTSSTGGGLTLDTSVSNTISLGATWGTSSASNTLTCFQWLCELAD